MDRFTLELFARSEVLAKWECGFLTSQLGWVPYLGKIKLFSPLSMHLPGARHPTGLFATEAEALRAGESYRRECRARIAAGGTDDACARARQQDHFRDVTKMVG
ncbi:MAG: hypothetical protein HQL97_04410 [Magnetococcales bacterium]|nr:hypothetical protein [Magnetococcales bacterium]